MGEPTSAQDQAADELWDPPQQSKKMGKGKKALLIGGGVFVALAVIGSVLPDQKAEGKAKEASSADTRQTTTTVEAANVRREAAEREARGRAAQVEAEQKAAAAAEAQRVAAAEPTVADAEAQRVAEAEEQRVARAEAHAWQQPNSSASGKPKRNAWRSRTAARRRGPEECP